MNLKEANQTKESQPTSQNQLHVQTGSKLGQSLVAILLFIAFVGFIVSFSVRNGSINFVDFSTVPFFSGRSQTSQNSGDILGTPSIPTQDQPNQTSSQSIDTSEPFGAHTQIPRLPDSIPEGPTADVIKNSGKRIKLDNPLPYIQISDLIIEKEDYIPHLEIQWAFYGPNHLNIVIRDTDKERFEIPLEDPYPRPRQQPLKDLEGSNFIVEIETAPFSMLIKRKSTQEVIFELVDRLVYTDLYLEFTVRTPTNQTYGFGERTHGLQFDQGTYTLYIIDRSGAIDMGQPGFNTNGHQSLYLMAEKSKLYHLFLLRNTNSQEVVIKENNEITWKAIGGVLDFNLFLGNTPEEAIDLYHEYIGGWALPALWHLGSHQGKWKDYANTDILEQVLEGYERAKLPLDGLWSDLEYTINQINLLFDEVNFPPETMQELYRKYKKRWIPVIQFYIPFQKESYAWNFPDVLSIAIKDGKDPSIPITGVELSGDIYFVDNWHPKAEEFWYMMYDYLDSKVPLGGLWLDANEVTTFLHINWPKANRDIHSDHIQNDKTRKYYKLPFYPGKQNLYDVPIIDIDSVHYGGVIEYNVRSYNCLHQARHAYTYLQKQGYYFPFVLTRGNTMGSGQFGYHFIPDINSFWDEFRASNGQVYMYNIYGMPMVGADICGMGGKTQTDPELCARWYQLATFYGFARNHHAPGNGQQNSQEPYTYSDVYFQAISSSIMLRYSYLKQFYALFFLKKRGLRGTGTFLRPLFFEFPHDANLPEYGHHVHEDQFMVGNSLLVTPNVYPYVETVQAYIPDWRWFDMRDYKELTIRGQIGDISAKLSELPPHFLRGGRIFFKQDTAGVMRTADLSNKFTLIAALNDLNDTEVDKLSEAYGHIMSASDYEEKYIYENCALKSCMLKATVTYKFNKKDLTTNISLKAENVVTTSTIDAVEVIEVHVLGLDPESLVNARNIECSNCHEGESLQISQGNGWIKITGIKLDFRDGVSYDFKLSNN